MTFASTGVPQTPTQSRRDREYSKEMAEKPREQTETEKLADFYLAHHKQREAEKATAEQAELDCKRQRDAQERQKQAAADAAYELFDATADEMKIVNYRLATYESCPASRYVAELRRLRVARAA